MTPSSEDPNPEVDPMLQDLLEGRLQEGDPRVRERFEAEPELSRSWLELRGLRGLLDEHGAQTAQDLEAASQAAPTANEDRLLEGFRAAAMGAGEAPKLRLLPDETTGESPLRTRPWLRWVATLAAMLLAALAASVWIDRPTGSSTTGSGYLTSGADVFLTEGLPFGTIRWKPVPNAASYRLRALDPEGNLLHGPSEVLAGSETWSVPAEALATQPASLRFELEALDGPGGSLEEASLVQPRP